MEFLQRGGVVGSIGREDKGEISDRENGEMRRQSKRKDEYKERY